MKPTRNAVEGKSGTAKSLADLPSKSMLSVRHSFGPTISDGKFLIAATSSSDQPLAATIYNWPAD
jgi:hypothetical protein